jgi:pseudouridine-5'-monophosphatase
MSSFLIVTVVWQTNHHISGAERLLNHLRNHKIPMSLATASHQTQFELKTKRHLEIFQRVFDHIVTGDQVP